MGLFGGSSKSSTSNNTSIATTTNNINQAGAESAFSLNGSGNTVTTTDNGAVNNALEASVLNSEKVFNFANSALKFDSEKSARVFEFGNKSVDGAYNLSKTISDNLLKANKDVLNLAQNNARDSYNFVRTLKNPGVENDANNFQALAKWGALSIAGLAVVFMLKGAK